MLNTSKKAYQIESLKHFFKSNTPLILVIGKEGCGKTDLINHFIGSIQKQYRIIRLQGDSSLQPTELTTLISQHWDFYYNPLETKYRYQLDEILNKLSSKNQSSVLVVDSADLLPISTLAALSHLAIKQEGQSVNIHVILLGEFGLLKKIGGLQAKRIPCIQVEPLTLKETQLYIKQCISELSTGKLPELTNELIHNIHSRSNGLPVVIKRMTQEWLDHYKSNQPQKEILEKPLPAISEKSFETKRVSHAKKTPPTLWQQHWVKIISTAGLLMIGLLLWRQQKIHSPSLAQQSVIPPKQPISKVAKSFPQTNEIAEAVDALIHAPPAHAIKPKKYAINKQKPKPKPKPKLKIATKASAASQHNSTSKPLTVAKKHPHTTTKKYTVQLMGSYSQKSLKQFIAKNNIQKSTQIVETTNHGKKWYVVAYGQFNNYQEAKKSQQHLPQALKVNHPWVRRLSFLNESQLP